MWRHTLSHDGATAVPVVDHAAIMNLRELQEEGEPDLLRELVAMFEEDAISRLTTIEQAVRDVNPVCIVQEAHALKGSCSNFGARPMALACDQLETASRSGDLVRVPALVNQLLVEYDRVCAALAAELAMV